MNGKWQQPRREPTPAELAAWADGELGPPDAERVERWLAEHPEAGHEADALRHLVRLYRDHPAPDPAGPSWDAALGRIEAGLAARPAQARAWRWRLLAGLVVAAAASLAAVVLARALWPTPPAEEGPAPGPGPVAVVPPDEEPFPVATAGEVNIIRMDPRDADRVVVGVPLMPGSIELVGTEEVEIVQVEGDPAEGWMPHVQRSAGGPMIIVARTDEDEEP
jgi:hypothetical protein